MSSGSAAFKAAVAAAVFALLVLPSLGRCPSLGPAPPPPAPVPPPPPAPAPVPAPAPSPVSCSDCYPLFAPACESKCEPYLAAACSTTCDPGPCDKCHADVSNCTACCDDGSCPCDCKNHMDMSCRSGCYSLYRNCPECIEMASLRCMGDCLGGPCAGCRHA